MVNIDFDPKLGSFPFYLFEREKIGKNRSSIIVLGLLNLVIRVDALSILRSFIKKDNTILFDQDILLKT